VEVAPQRHLAEGSYALSLAWIVEEAYQVLMGRAATTLPSPHWCVGGILEEERGPRVVTFGVQSLLGLLLVFEGRIIGVLSAIALRGEVPVAPAEAHLSILQGLARIAALVLERLRAQSALEESASSSRRSR
jgi:GAF domain-containing protein